MGRVLLQCKRCGHSWLSSKENPRSCAKCKSNYWNTYKKGDDRRKDERIPSDSRNLPAADESGVRSGTVPDSGMSAAGNPKGQQVACDPPELEDASPIVVKLH